MIEVNINFDPQDVFRVKLLLNDIEANQVMVGAINDTLPGVETDAVREATGYLNLRAERVRANFTRIRAYTGNATGAWKSIGRPANLASFIGTTETISDYNGGVSVRVLRSGSRERLKHAFMWSRPSGGGLNVSPGSGLISGEISQTVMQREWHDFHTFRSRFSPWKRMGPRYRLPVETLTGPRVEDVLGRDGVIAIIETQAGERLENNVDRRLELIMSRH